MAAPLTLPLSPALDLNANPLAGAKLDVFITDTTTPATVYQDSALTTPHPNPVIASSDGKFPTIYLSPSVIYRFRVRDTSGAPIAGYDFNQVSSPATLAVLSAVTGSALVGFQGEGTGAQPITAQRFMLNQPVYLTDYYAGTLGTGADITTALQRAIDAAFSRRNPLGGVTKVIIPAGYYFQLSATITIPSCVIVEGAGKIETYLRRTGNYGNTFVIGTANPATNVQCAGIRNLAIFHDHGGGTTPSTNPLSWVNSVTGSPAHIVLYTPVGCIVENVSVYSLPFGIICQGGSLSTFRNIDTYGVYDDANTAMQEGLAGFLMAGDTTVTGSIPTWHHIDFCRFGGMTRASTSVTYYGGNTKTTVKNIGPQNGIVLWMAESVFITNCYTGACNSSGIVISGKSTDIISGVFISNHFFDPCGVKFQDACFKLENRDAGSVVDGVTLSIPQFKGQQNGWRAISDYGSTATLGSVKDLIVAGGHASVFVGNPIELTNVRRASINMSLAAYNCENYYAVNADLACAVHITSGANNVVIGGSLGGGVYGEVASGANNRCVDGVRADDYVTSRVTVTAVDAGLAGSLFVGPPAYISDSTLDADFTLTSGGSSRYVRHTGTLTANRAVTLSTSNAKDGDVFHVARTGAGAFNLTVNGKALATGQWALFVYSKAANAWRQVGYGTL